MEDFRDEIKSRLCQNLVLEIGQPDFDFNKEFLTRNIKIDLKEERIDSLASKAKTVSGLSGMVTKIMSYVDVLKKESVSDEEILELFQGPTVISNEVERTTEAPFPALMKLLDQIESITFKR